MTSASRTGRGRSHSSGATSSSRARSAAGANARSRCSRSALTDVAGTCQCAGARKVRSFQPARVDQAANMLTGEAAQLTGLVSREQLVRADQHDLQDSANAIERLDAASASASAQAATSTNE